jgi:ABC-type Fe3+/spermidine/putrescine transport system ATPase subunit
MADLEVMGVSKFFGQLPAVRDVSLTADRSDLVCLLGPSGCGKSTLLRLIAGLEPLDAGSVRFGGKNLEGVAPHERGFGLMFQDLALFPHMDVLGNVGFGLRIQRQSTQAVRKRVDELLELVGLAGYGNRKVHELSGGERQRVALARSLAPAPKLLMLDEPLASLDRVLRESLQTQVRTILKEVGVTAIYVTHDKDEAFAIADSIIFMNDGLVVQSGTPETLFSSPASELVARSMGVRNILPGRILRTAGPAQVTCAIGRLIVDGAIPGEIGPGSDVLVLVDERGIRTVPAHASAELPAGSLTGIVVHRAFRGNESELYVRVRDGHLICLVPQRDAGAAIGVGDVVALVIPPTSVSLLATPAARRADEGQKLR